MGDKRQQEADEWQEVAMNTKREADVKAESMARLKGNADDKTSELEAKIAEMQKKNEDVSRNNLELGTRIVAMEEEKVRTVKEAEEWQEVAINTKRDGEAKIKELEQSLRSRTEEKATMQKELDALRG